MSKKQERKEKDKKEGRKIKYLLFIMIFVILVAVGLGIYVWQTKQVKEQDSTEVMSYTDLLKAIEEETIEKIEMNVGENAVRVKLKGEEQIKDSSVPSIQAFMELIQNKVEEGKQIDLIQNKQKLYSSIKDNVFPIVSIVLIGSVVFLIYYQFQGGSSKGKVYEANDKDRIKLEDVAGLEEEKAELVEIVDFLKDPDSFEEMGAKVPKGILLCGQPGTGKTLIAKAIAGEADVPFIPMSGSEFIEMFAGLGASRVRKLFERAKKESPCIIFIDEIDAIGSSRSTGSNGAETENNQTLNQLLIEMDGFEKNQTIIVLAATNRPELLDKALLRPGRFDRQIMIAPPDLRGREEILKVHSKNKKLEDGVSLRSIAEDTAGFTGAELANILNEAAILATIRKQKAISQKDIEDAVKKVTVGLEKKNRVISEKDKKLTAYHEAGHAIVSRFLPTQEEVKEVSIIPRGMAGGYTMYRNGEDKFYVSKTEMEEKLIALLGGRAAEKLALNDISTGASNDIEVATKIATDMVTVYGMSDTLGPVAYKKDNKDLLPYYGENIEDKIGQEIKKLIDSSYVKAQSILADNMDKLHAVSHILLEREVITAEEFERIFDD